MDLNQLRKFGELFYYGVCVLAVLRGDQPLRFAGVAMMICGLVSPISRWGHIGDQPYWLTLGLDVILLAALAAILLRQRRWWLVVAAGLMLMGVMTHFAAMIGSPIGAFETSAARAAWVYGSVAALAWGLAQHELRNRRGDAV